MSEMEYKVKEAPTCPHCKSVMEQMDSRHLDWGLPYLWVCFNNNCTFFMKGWKHMMESYGQLVSYRFMIQPDSGTVGVIRPSAMNTCTSTGSRATRTSTKSDIV